MTCTQSGPDFLSARVHLASRSGNAFGVSRVLRVVGCLGVLALLSACAGGPHISATQEAAQYVHRARGSYTPPGPRSDPWGPYITEASARFDVPERWIREVMRVESGGRAETNGVPTTSGAGAMGLMQVMPATYDELRGRYSLGDDPYDPHNSILAGTAYIRELYDLYGSPGFLAAYNGGPGRLDDYLTRNRPLADETRRYVAKIGPYIVDSFPNKRSVAEQYAMNAVPANIPSGPRYNSGATQTAAYVPPAPVAPAPMAPQPVEVAYAPPSDNDGAFNPPPGWKPSGMSKGEIAAYVPPPATPPTPAQVSLASAETFTPAPVATRPEPAPVMAYAPLPPVAAPQQQYAALPEPPEPPAARRERGFRLVAPALAAPSPIYRGSPGQWAIQVGAFGNEGLAHIAVGNAREQAGAVLSGAHPTVAGVREQHGTLYRARLTGLSRDAATQACQRLRGHTNCIVLSPDAQS